MRSRPFILGLTGSIGMGKTTAAENFRRLGVPVFDADQVVARLYSAEAAPLIEQAFPGTVCDGTVDRERLAHLVLADQSAIRRLEAIVHPLVRLQERSFLDSIGAAGAQIAVLDIPLLFETGGEARCDAVVVVSAPAAAQRQRVLARPGMTQERFDAILRRQMPDAEKRNRAHFVIDTSRSHSAARRQVQSVVRALAGRPTRQPG
ncbi:dephospho-CoA kinase [Rhizobiales bacterium GAS191]|jgi:dephospho-CoA kinase|nr:dephospho-CoA kinase [Rhizobiales bacterium GAS113]SEC14315.1 dephospho-CoA kinase [Rhizobiales bacterium GAS191]SED06492.1 dephospho-CoA kinase [Rhizobiales bacterium GAS188]